MHCLSATTRVSTISANKVRVLPCALSSARKTNPAVNTSESSKLEALCARAGWQITETAADGNCGFRAYAKLCGEVMLS